MEEGLLEPTTNQFSSDPQVLAPIQHHHRNHSHDGTWLVGGGGFCDENDKGRIAVDLDNPWYLRILVVILCIASLPGLKWFMLSLASLPGLVWFMFSAFSGDSGNMDGAVWGAGWLVLGSLVVGVVGIGECVLSLRYACNKITLRQLCSSLWGLVVCGLSALLLFLPVDSVVGISKRILVRWILVLWLTWYLVWRKHCWGVCLGYLGSKLKKV